MNHAKAMYPNHCLTDLQRNIDNLVMRQRLIDQRALSTLQNKCPDNALRTVESRNAIDWQNVRVVASTEREAFVVEYFERLAFE
jgi:hypothetical protein